MGDKTFCHVAGSSRVVQVDRVEGFIWTLVCDVSLRLFSHGLRVSWWQEEYFRHHFIKI